MMKKESMREVLQKSGLSWSVKEYLIQITHFSFSLPIRALLITQTPIL